MPPPAMARRFPWLPAPAQHSPPVEESERGAAKMAGGPRALLGAGGGKARRGESGTAGWLVTGRVAGGRLVPRLPPVRCRGGRVGCAVSPSGRRRLGRCHCRVFHSPQAVGKGWGSAPACHLSGGGTKSLFFSSSLESPAFPTLLSCNDLYAIPVRGWDVSEEASTNYSTGIKCFGCCWDT